jgi:hypothetical protein
MRTVASVGATISDLREHVSKGVAPADNARADFVVRSDLGQRNVPLDRLMARADPRDC